MVRICVLAAVGVGAFCIGQFAHAGANYTGMWRSSCNQAFGLQIKPVNETLYSVSFCGPGGCFRPGTYRPNTKIEKDPLYRVLSPTQIMVKLADGNSELYNKCSDDPTPSNPKMLN